MIDAVFTHVFNLSLEQELHNLHWIFVVIGLIAGIMILGKSADALVDDATELSLSVGVPQVVVGATIVSLGTTVPEAVVSVFAALGGNPGIALGNAVGSIICDTGLILGIACLIAPIPLDRWLVNRQGYLQFGAGILLVLLCVPWTQVDTVFETGGVLPQWAGFLFIGLLCLYMLWSIRVAGRHPSTTDDDDAGGARASERSVAAIVTALLVATFFVVLSSEILIESAKDIAVRMTIPEGVIAATVVAFGTSLPELVIAVTASLRGRGGLAIGNVIGADILNVLFVAGAAAAATPGGLVADPEFFVAQFPAMIAVLVTFRVSVVLALRKGNLLPRKTGFVLVGFYVAYLIVTAALPRH